MNTPPPKNQNSGKSMGGCERCGKIVVLTRFTLCYDCRRLESLEMEKALDYLGSHKGASVMQIANATGVDADMILKFFQNTRGENREKDLKEKIRQLHQD